MQTMRVVIISLSVMCCLGWSLSLMAADIEIEGFYNKIDGYRTTQYVCGESKEVIVVGKGFSMISAVEITPSEHIQVKEVKEVEATQQQKNAGMKAWSFVVVTEKNAQVGERTIVLITPEGKSKPETIIIAPYVPKINNVKVLSTKLSQCTVEIVLSVFYEGKDLETGSYVIGSVKCGGRAYISNMKPDRVIKKSEQEYEIQGIIYCADPSSSCSGPCELVVWIYDKNGYESDCKNIVVEFKE
jgi:hypothetical protein